MKEVKAPWTKEQVEALNYNQNSEALHPYTCPEPHEDYEDRVLIATENGWECRKCGYHQNWAWDFTMEKRDPFWKSKEKMIEVLPKMAGALNVKEPSKAGCINCPPNPPYSKNVEETNKKEEK